LKSKVLGIILLALAMIISACGGGSNSAGGDNGESAGSQSLVFGTGGTSGTYYPIGGALKPIFEQSDSIGNITVESTGASVANIQNIQDGLNQMAVVMSDVAYDAVEGKGQFEGKKVDVKALALSLSASSRDFNVYPPSRSFGTPLGIKLFTP